MVDHRTEIYSPLTTSLNDCQFISQTAETIPSPSAMHWRDVGKVLYDQIPDLHAPPQGKIPPGDTTQKLLNCFSRHFRRTSEMEAVLRVSLLVMQAIDELDVTVELQPSIQGYPYFTDFALVFKDSDYPISFSLK